MRGPDFTDRGPAESRGNGVLLRIADLWWALGGEIERCHPARRSDTSVSAVGWTLAVVGPGGGALLASDLSPTLSTGMARPITGGAPTTLDVDAFVVDLFRSEGLALVRLARLFVDDRNAAEDLVQEAFIRLARSADRIRDPQKAGAYLRSIVLNLARDHNRRGLVSLRHQLPLQEITGAAADEDLVLREDQAEVLDALRDLPRQQRNCVVLRHLEERGIAEIAAILGISENSVKTHLRRGMAALASRLGEPI